MLTAAIKKKEEALAAEAKAQDEANRVAAEAQEQTEKLLKSMTNAAAQQQQSTGLIGKLSAQIEALEKKKLLPDATIEDIAAANAEIAKLKVQLTDLQKVCTERHLWLGRRHEFVPVPKLDGNRTAGGRLYRSVDGQRMEILGGP